VASRLDPGGDDLDETHEINVTPFIDVILVLLIIFMVAAPLATVDVPVDLPASTAAPQPRPDAPLFVTLTASDGIVVGETPVSADRLAAALDAATGGDKEQRVFLRADKAVTYGDLAVLMNGLREAGYLKIALVGLDAGSLGAAGRQPAGSAAAGSGPAGPGGPMGPGGGDPEAGAAR
jgi:biopolymer transport protein ExbD